MRHALKEPEDPRHSRKDNPLKKPESPRHLSRKGNTRDLSPLRTLQGHGRPVHQEGSDSPAGKRGGPGAPPLRPLQGQQPLGMAQEAPSDTSPPPRILDCAPHSQEDSGIPLHFRLQQNLGWWKRNAPQHIVQLIKNGVRSNFRLPPFLSVRNQQKSTADQEMALKVLQEYLEAGAVVKNTLEMRDTLCLGL